MIMLISSLFQYLRNTIIVGHRRFARRLDFCADGRWPLATKLLYVFCSYSVRGGGGMP
jgi:hypothetical protein